MGRKVKLCVEGYDENFVLRLDEFYRLLQRLNARYTFKCRRGRCTSVITVDASYVGVLKSFPGLQLSKECARNLLLPPPVSEVARLADRFTGSTPLRPGRGFVLGVTGSTPIEMDPMDFLRHALIVGSTGSGKTHTASRIARCLVKEGFRVVVIDWHGEYSVLLREFKLYRGEELPPIPILAKDLTIEDAVSVLEYVFNLTQFQSTILSAVLGAALGPVDSGAASILSSVLGSEIDVEDIALLIRADNTIRGLARAVATLYGFVKDTLKSKGENEVWLALLRRLNSVALTPYAKLFLITGGDNVNYEGGVIIDLSSISSSRVKKLYSLLLLYKAYSDAMRKPTPTIFIIDEAQHVVESRVFNEVVSEARKYLLGVVAVTHTQKIIPENIRSNFNTIIVHKLISPEDRKIAAELLGDKTLADLLQKLQPGEAVVSSPSLEGIVLVKVSLDMPCK